MKGQYGGPMTVDEFFQALYQDHEFFRSHGIAHIRQTYLYFTPCDEYGHPVIIADRHGNIIDGYVSAGCYNSAATAYENKRIEAHPIIRVPRLTYEQ